MKIQTFFRMVVFVVFVSTILSHEALADNKYTVRRGDSLYAISNATGVSVQALKEANGLTSDSLRVSQILIIPGEKTGQSSVSKQNIYVVKRGDNLSSISKKVGMTVNEIKKLNHLKNNRLMPGQELAVLLPVVNEDAQNKNPYVVKRGDSLSSISKKVGMTISEIRELNHLKNNRLMPGQKLTVLTFVTKEESVREKDEQADSKNPTIGEKSPDSNVATIASEEPTETGQETEGAIEEEGLATENRNLLGVWRDTEEVSLFVRVVRSFEGTPYRYGGSSVRGTDCSGFVKKIYKIFGIELPRTAREQSKVGKRVPKDELMEGDLVFFNNRGGFGHVGIYIGNNEFIHASPKHNSVRVDSIKESYFKRHFVRAIRIKGLEKETTVSMSIPSSKDKL